MVWHFRLFLVANWAIDCLLHDNSWHGPSLHIELKNRIHFLKSGFVVEDLTNFLCLHFSSVYNIDDLIFLCSIFLKDLVMMLCVPDTAPMGSRRTRPQGVQSVNAKNHLVRKKIFYLVKCSLYFTLFFVLTNYADLFRSKTASQRLL